MPLHLLADDLLDLAQHPVAQRQPRVHARRRAADVAGADEQAVAGHLGVGRVVAQRAQEQGGHPHEHDREGTGGVAATPARVSGAPAGSGPGHGRGPGRRLARRGVPVPPERTVSAPTASRAPAGTVVCPMVGPRAVPSSHDGRSRQGPTLWTEPRGRRARGTRRPVPLLPATCSLLRRRRAGPPPGRRRPDGDRLRRAVRTGRSCGLGRGRYALPGTDDALATALTPGGCLSHVSAAAAPRLGRAAPLGRHVRHAAAASAPTLGRPRSAGPTPC